MSVTAPSAVKAALKTLLEADNDLSGVTVYTSPESADTLDREHVVLGNVKGRNEPFAMGYTFLSTYDIECTAMFHKPAKSDTVDRAWVLLQNVSDIVAGNWTVSGNTLDAEVTDWEYDEMPHPDGKGWQTTVEFTIAIKDLGTV